MPELPEVHTITQDIKKHVVGTNIVNVTISQAYNALPQNDLFVASVQNTHIIDATRIGKNIILKLSNNSYLGFHLAMTGRILLRKVNYPKDKWLRVSFILKKNNKQYELRFCDMRMFGKVFLIPQNSIENFNDQYGPDPLNETLTPDAFHKILTSKNTNIKNVLLDQSLISGLGNAYATDALWLAKIHPETKTKDISLKHAQNLFTACKELLTEGIKHRGISMSDYVDLFGKKGEQQKYFRIYKKEKCTRCNIKVSFKKLNGRGTYFCSNCQVLLTKSGLFNDN